MRFGVLGPLAVWTDHGEPVTVPGRKVRALLADLLVHEGRVVSADQLVEDLWGEAAPADPTAALHVRVSQLRRALAGAEEGGKDLVVSQAPGYVLRAGTDAAQFADLVERAQSSGDPRGLLAEALDLWRGPALADFADEEFARTAIARWEEQRLATLEAYAEARLATGEHRALAGELGEHVARHPFRERLRAAHLRSLHRSGRTSEALDSFQELRRQLADELGLDPGPELTTLHNAVLAGDPTEDAPATRPARATTNLPAPVTELIGREHSVARVRELLSAGRLVTLTGPGGVGKTSVAVAAGRALAGSYPDGVWLVDLTTWDGSGDAAEPVLSVLSIPDTADGPAPERLAAALRDRRTVLVLDNCEHVVEPVADLATTLLAAAPDLRVLATSREPLRLRGEARFDLPPLDIPETDDPERLRRSPAVRMFLTRAGLPEDVADTVTSAAEVCRRLDGIPLALELAAGRVPALGVAELAVRLRVPHDRFGLLGTGPRDAPARQRTLAAVIDWSWQLLNDAERTVLRRLAVHSGGSTLAAAEAVCADTEATAGAGFGAGAIAGVGTVAGTATNTGHGTTAGTATDAGVGTKHGTTTSAGIGTGHGATASAGVDAGHGTVASSATNTRNGATAGTATDAGHGTTAGATTDTGVGTGADPGHGATASAGVDAGHGTVASTTTDSRHGAAAGTVVTAGAVLDLLAGLVDRSLVVRDAASRFRLLESVAAYCTDRLREAGEETVLRRRHADHYLTMAEQVEPLLRGPGQREWLSRLDAEAANLRTALDTFARTGAAEQALRLAVALVWYWFLRGRLTEALRALTAALAVPGEASDAIRASAEVWQAGLAIRLGQAGPERVAEVLRWYDKLTDQVGLARAEWFLAASIIDFGDEKATSELLGRALDTFRSVGDRWGEAAVLSTRAMLAHMRFDLTALEHDARRGAELFAELGDDWGGLQASDWLIGLADLTGDHAEAVRLSRESLRTAEDMGLWSDVAGRLGWLAWLSVQVEDYPQAREYAAQALRLATEQGRAGEVFVTLSLAYATRRSGELDVAEEHLRWLLRTAREQQTDGNSPPYLPMVLTELGSLAEQRRDPTKALAWHQEAFDLVGSTPEKGVALTGMAAALALDGRHGVAARLLGAAESARKDGPRSAMDRTEQARVMAAVEAGEPDFTALFAEGTELTPEQARSLLDENRT